MKIGLYGGAFNPIHNGHIKVAQTAIRYMSLDKLIFIPSGNAPHKKEGSVSRADRLEMLKAAIRGNDKMEISDYELLRDEVSYSADTVEHFKRIYKNDELFFLIGDDSYNELDTWHEPQRIIQCARLLVFPRIGCEVALPAVKIPMEKADISSSNIRERIRSGKDCTNVLPKDVFDYIIKNNLYKGENAID